ALAEPHRQRDPGDDAQGVEADRERPQLELGVGGARQERERRRIHHWLAEGLGDVEAAAEPEADPHRAAPPLPEADPDAAGLPPPSLSICWVNWACASAATEVFGSVNLVPLA